MTRFFLTLTLTIILGLTGCKGGEKKPGGDDAAAKPAAAAAASGGPASRQALIDATLAAVKSGKAEGIIALSRGPEMIKAACPNLASADAFADAVLGLEMSPEALAAMEPEALEARKAQMRSVYEANMGAEGAEKRLGEAKAAIASCADFPKLAEAKITTHDGGAPDSESLGARICGNDAAKGYTDITARFEAGGVEGRITIQGPGEFEGVWSLDGVRCEWDRP